MTCSRGWAGVRLVSSLQQAGLSRRLFLLYLRSKLSRDTHTQQKQLPRQVWHSAAVDAAASSTPLAIRPEAKC